MPCATKAVNTSLLSNDRRPRSTNGRRSGFKGTGCVWGGGGVCPPGRSASSSFSHFLQRAASSIHGKSCFSLSGEPPSFDNILEGQVEMVKSTLAAPVMFAFPQLSQMERPFTSLKCLTMIFFFSNDKYI